MENCMTNRQANPTILPLHVHDNQNGLDYTLHGDYYLPDIKNPETDSRPIGKWGRMHLVYLKEHIHGKKVDPLGPTLLLHGYIHDQSLSTSRIGASAASSLALMRSASLNLLVSM